MSASARALIGIGCAAALAVGLTACAGAVPGAEPTMTGGPYRVSVSPSPKIVHVEVPGAPAIVPGPQREANTGTPPSDAAALARAKRWIVAATPPPGVHVLDTAPSPAPTHPAQLAACDWLVRATKWWATDAANVTAATTWLRAHPIDGLRFDESMSGSGGLSAITASPPGSGNDFLSFEFVPGTAGAPVTIAVDVLIVPKGAVCTSSGGGPVPVPAH